MIKNSHRVSADKGFTIVEMIIVLAVAGMILLVILLALPLLIRSGHNNQRRQDVQVVLQAVSRYELNNTGRIPNTHDLQDFLTTYELKKLSYYEPSHITVNTPAATKTPETYPSVPLGNDDMIINNHAKCQADGRATNRGAGYSDVVALFRIETADGMAFQCQQL